MATFDDIPISPRASSATRGGRFSDIPVTAPAEPPSGWTGWLRDLFSGASRTEFPQAEEFHVAARRGGITREEADSVPRGRDPQTAMEHVRRALGSTEFDAPPPAPDERPTDMGAIARSGITPDPQAQLDILRRHIPELEHRTDRFGNIMLRAPRIGVNDWTYLNAPGASSRDLDEAATQILATLPFGAAVGLGRTLLARAGIGAVATGGASVAQDVMAERLGSDQGIDPTRAAIAGGIGTVAGPVAGWLGNRARSAPTPLAVRRADNIAEDLAAHERLDVRPFGPAFSSGPMASTARQLAETPLMGRPVRSALEESISDTARASSQIAERFGQSQTADEAGLIAREGLERFRDARPTDVVERTMAGYTPAQRAAIIAAPVRNTSLKTKQAALYEQAWSRIPEEMQAGRAVEGLPRVMGQMANTRQVLDQIAARNTRMLNASADDAEAASRPISGSGFLGQVIEAIRNPNWRAALQTMRDIRSDFRRLASKTADSEANTLRISDIERVQSAITRDMIALLERNVDRYTGVQQHQVAANIRRAIVEFRHADRFTRAGAERMEAIEKLFNADSATGLYAAIARAALGGSRGDVNKIRILAKTLRREEMDEIAAYTLRAMGQPVASARGHVQEIGFSPSSFMTRLNNMQPEAKNLIFGHAHVQALNDLGRVVNRLANVEALTNTSRSGTNLLNMGMLLGGGGMAASGQWEYALGMAAAGTVASVLFSRPAYVKWVQGYAQLRAAARQAPSKIGPALAAHIGRLETMARSDPGLLPVVRRLRVDEPVRPEEEKNPRPARQR
jgi:hypothetical protein